MDRRARPRRARDRHGLRRGLRLGRARAHRRSVVGVDANPEAFEHARLRYPAANLRFERELVEQFDEPADAVVFLQTIEHLQDPSGTLAHFRSLVGEGGAVYVSTPNVLTLAPKGASRSGNPWHVHEYLPEEFEELCRGQFERVELYGLFHARKLRVHELALRLGWDRVHAALHLTKPFYGWFTPAIGVARLRAAQRSPRGAARRAGLARGVPAVSARSERGALAIVLHTHMPYVEGFGTWPFGEEWLWEAIAGSYLPLLGLLDRGAPLTLSLTPVLCDQLEVPGLGARFERFVEEVRRETHREDAEGLRAGGHERLAAELERAWGDYARAAEQLDGLGGDLLGAFGAHAGWTSSATHAVLPLLASDAGLREQVRAGVRSHERRFGDGWRGGFWLPECAHEPSLESELLDAGVTAVCVELTARLGLGAPEHLRPVLAESGLVLVPVDRRRCRSSGARRATRPPAPTATTTTTRSTTTTRGTTPASAYDHDAALALAREHAADFVARTNARLAAAGAGQPGGGLVVCALDTELLGHWWYEGIAWLEAVVEESARQGLELVALDDALASAEPAQLPGQAEWAASSWGEDGDLSTWSGPQVAELAFDARAAELEVSRAGPGAGRGAVRAMLALQASDWAFMVTRGIAVPYARERQRGHRELVTRALAGEEAAVEGALRNLAVDADPADFVAPL